MKISGWICLLFLLAPALLLADQRPNVLFILSDDQGWGDYGFMGHPHIQTPRIDQLAAESLVYERGYVTAPLCRPSLASLATGQYPSQIGIRGNDPVGYSDSQDKAAIRARMTEPFGQHPSFIKELQAHGYANLQTGKWWEGDPTDHGFDEAMTHGDVTRGGRHGDEGLKIGRETLQPIRDFIEKAQGEEKPFFIWYGVFLPHTPHNAPERFFSKYKDVAPNLPTAWYWANCEWFDETCGQLVDMLKEKGIYENTLIVYTCDNGWIQNPKKRNRFAPRSKQQPYEMGIRTPIFLTHPGKIKPVRDTTTLASNIDVASTILKACGIDVPEEMQGLDLRDRAGLQERNRIFVEAYDHDSDLDRLDERDHGLKARVVITGWDKLIRFPDHAELYDLKADPHETDERSAHNPEKVKELEGILDRWLERISKPSDGTS